MTIDPPYRLDPLQNPVNVKWEQEGPTGGHKGWLQTSVSGEVLNDTAGNILFTGVVGSTAKLWNAARTSAGHPIPVTASGAPGTPVNFDLGDPQDPFLGAAGIDGTAALAGMSVVVNATAFVDPITYGPFSHSFNFSGVSLTGLGPSPWNAVEITGFSFHDGVFSLGWSGSLWCQ